MAKYNDEPQITISVENSYGAGPQGKIAELNLSEVSADVFKNCVESLHELEELHIKNPSGYYYKIKTITHENDRLIKKEFNLKNRAGKVEKVMNTLQKMKYGESHNAL